MAKPLIIGECPSRTGDRYHQFPLSGAVGKRLCEWAGIDPLERDRSMTSEFARWYWALRERFDLDNLYEHHQPSYPPQAKVRGDLYKLLEKEYRDTTVVVLLGQRLGRAAWGGLSHYYHWHPLLHTKSITIPHPSGLNRKYNEEREHQAASDALREALRRA